MKIKCYDEFLKHYDEFYFMLRSTCLLGTRNCEKFNKDSSKIIAFISSVYNWNDELRNEATKFILGDLMQIGLAADYNALASEEMIDEDIKDNLIFYEAKGKAIEEVNQISFLYDNNKLPKEVKNHMNYTSFHHSYEPKVAFSKICEIAKSGEINTTVQEALMLILGIGCKKSIADAQILLERAVIWKEKVAADILAFLWSTEDAETENFYYEVSKMINHTSTGYESVLTQKLNHVTEFCCLIEAVNSFVTKSIGKRQIDILFADYLRQEDISFKDKMQMIIKYKDGIWLTKHICKKETKEKIGII